MACEMVREAPDGSEQFAQRGGQHIGATTMSDKVALVQLWRRAQRTQKLLQMKDRELARFAVVVIASEATSRASRPGIDDWDALAAQKMPPFRHDEYRYRQAFQELPSETLRR